MIHLKNIQVQNAKTPEQLELTKRFDVAWLFSEDGKNWYEELKNFAPDTLKIAYDRKGVIRSVNMDVTTINPINKSVIELPATTANRRADISGRWGFDGTSIIDLMTLDKARQQKTAEISKWRDTQENGNIIFTLNGHQWDCGKESQVRLAPVIAVAKSCMLPPDFFWTDADNIDVPMTTDELAALETAMQQSMVIGGFKIHERQRQMKEDIARLTSVSDVLNYPVGWPDNNSN